MSGTLVFMIVVVSLFGGVALTALGVFLYFFYKAVKRLTVVAEEVYAVISPLAQGNTLTQMLLAFQSTNKMGQKIVEGLASITATVEQFNRYYYGSMQGATAQSQPAKTADAIDFNNADSFFVAPTEEEGAMREVEAQLRKEGVETNENAWPSGEPPLSQQVGENV